MSDLAAILQHSLIYGAILSALLSLLIYGSIYVNPEIWLNDYPPDIKARYGPISGRAKKQRTCVSIPFFLLLIGFMVLSILQLRRITGGELTFAAVFLNTFILLLTFNVVDLLILDWLVMVTLQPKFAILPGTEGMKGYRDYAFHFRGFLIGTAFCLVASLVVAAITMAVVSFSG